MAGRTPPEAVNAFLEPLGRAVSCVTNAVANVRGSYYPSPNPHSLTLNDGSAIRLANGLLIVIDLRYRVVQDVEPRGPWKVSVAAYFYTLANAARQEIISYQWHPAGPSPVTFPHLHLGQASRVGYEQVGQAHFPTGHITLQSFLRLIVTDFGVAPRRADWDAILTETEPAFTDWG